MNELRTMLVVVSFVLAASVHAQDCSGGPDGGMDASGNDCNRSNPVAANTATPKVNLPARNTTTRRSVAAADPVARAESAVSRERSVVAANPSARTPKVPESAFVAPRTVKISSTTGGN